MNRTLFRIEAILLALPAVVFMLWALPNIAIWVVAGWSATSSGDTSLYEAAVVPAVFVLGLFAFWVLARLVVATAIGRRFTFGVVFWVGLVCGLALATYLYVVFAPQVAAIVAAPLLFLAAHAALIQRREPQQGIHGLLPQARK